MTQVASTAITLLETLERSGATVSVYDIGRRVGLLSRDRALAFEQAREPYPLPMQRQAWLAYVQQHRESDDAAEPVIWFLRLPLDEQGLLVQATRDYLLQRLLESAQARSSGGDAQSFMQDNPYAFTPTETRMALFHAQLGADQRLPPSRFYDHAMEYFSGKLGWLQWEFVGYQGIADTACRHPGDPLAGAIPHIPEAPLVALCHCLENQDPAEALLTALLGRLDRALSDSQTRPDVPAALVRALSRSTDDPRVEEAMSQLLAAEVGGDVEVLAALSGRAWEALIKPDLLAAYLARLASGDHDHAVFSACVGDLLSLPDMADHLRGAMRDPDQPTEVREAFGLMLTGR
jgi:hypothetical protein